MRARWNVLVGAVVAALIGAGMPTAASAAPAVSTSVATAANTTNANGGEYVPLTMTRIADSRDGSGGYSTKLSGPGQRSYEVLGKGGVPTTGVSAVALQVTVTNVTSPNTFLTVWASGDARPDVSHLSVEAGDSEGNLLITELGAGGAVDVYLNAGAADVLIDVHGYFTTPSSTSAAGSFQVVSPVRFADTRIGLGLGATRVGPGEVRTLQITGV